MNRHGWKEQALQALRDIAQERLLITSDDLYDRIPEPEHHNQIGDVVRTAQQSGILIRTGCIVHSRRPSAKSRNIQLYRSGFMRFELNGDPVAAYLAQSPSPQSALFA